MNELNGFFFLAEMQFGLFGNILIVRKILLERFFLMLFFFLHLLHFLLHPCRLLQLLLHLFTHIVEPIIYHVN